MAVGKSSAGTRNDRSGWDRHFEAHHRKRLRQLRGFVAKHGFVGIKHAVVGGQNLGDWVYDRRRAYRGGRLPRWLAEELERVPGWSWHPGTTPTASIEAHHRSRLDLLERYTAAHGWQDCGFKWTVRGVKLGHWIHRCRWMHRQGTIEPWLAASLEGIAGWSWTSLRKGTDYTGHQHERVEMLRAFLSEHGWESLRGDTVVDGVRLGAWALRRRKEHRAGKLEPGLAEALEAIPGWSWTTFYRGSERHDAHLERRLALLRKYVAKHGWEPLSRYGHSVMVDGIDLNRWVQRCRQRHKAGTLSGALARALAELGWMPEPHGQVHRARLALLRALVDAHAAEHRDVIGDLVGLGAWLEGLAYRYSTTQRPTWLTRELGKLGWRPGARGPRDESRTRSRTSSGSDQPSPPARRGVPPRRASAGPRPLR